MGDPRVAKAMDVKAGVPFLELAIGHKDCTGTHRENVIPCGYLICLTAKLPINQIPNPDQLARCLEEYDIAKAEVPLDGHGFRVCIHYG